jgi:glycosyltransferase involved in cell wall biosynthesis
MNQDTVHRYKIMCISVMQNWGGGEEFLLNINDKLSDFEIIIVTPEGEAQKKFADKGIRTITNNYQRKLYRNSGWSPGAFIKIILNIKLSTFKLLWIIRKENPALVLTNGLFASLYALPALFLSRRRFIAVQHLIFNENTVEKRILRLVCRYAANIICVSEAVRENLSALSGRNADHKIIVIPNGIEISEIQDPVNRKFVRIGMIGSLIRIKGIDLVIKALKDILRSGEAELHLFGTAADDEDSRKYHNELKNTIVEYGLEDRIIFEGYVESKIEIYSRLDIVVSFSLIPESFSYSVLEAMSFKKIVVAVNAGGPKEIITDGQNGFLVESGNTGLLRDKIRYCIDNLDTDSFTRIRLGAFETVKNKYTMENFVQGYTKLFYSLINKTQ